MAQAVRRLPLTAQARVQSWWVLWRTKWRWDWFFSQYFGFPPSLPFHQCSIFIHSFIYHRRYLTFATRSAIEERTQNNHWSRQSLLQSTRTTNCHNQAHSWFFSMPGTTSLNVLGFSVCTLREIQSSGQAGTRLARCNTLALVQRLLANSVQSLLIGPHTQHATVTTLWHSSTTSRAKHRSCFLKRVELFASRATSSVSQRTQLRQWVGCIFPDSVTWIVTQLTSEVLQPWITSLFF
jgi:hypothetical protein